MVPPRLRTRLPLVLSGLVAAFGLLAALVWHGHRALGFDVSVQHALGVPNWSHRASQHLGDAAAALGSAPAVLFGSVLLAVAVYRRRGRDWPALTLTAIALPVALAVDRVVKPLVGRRYYGTGYRFPSGHAATVTALVTAAWLLLGPTSDDRPRTNRWPAVAAALATVGLVSWGLLVTRSHSPVDIVGGWLFGTGATLAFAGLLDGVARARAARASVHDDSS